MQRRTLVSIALAMRTASRSALQTGRTTSRTGLGAPARQRPTHDANEVFIFLACADRDDLGKREPYHGFPSALKAGCAKALVLRRGEAVLEPRQQPASF